MLEFTGKYEFFRVSSLTFASSITEANVQQLLITYVVESKDIKVDLFIKIIDENYHVQLQRASIKIILLQTTKRFKLIQQNLYIVESFVRNNIIQEGREDFQFSKA